jgi:hypothetical protein
MKRKIKPCKLILLKTSDKVEIFNEEKYLLTLISSCYGNAATERAFKKFMD